MEAYIGVLYHPRSVYHRGMNAVDPVSFPSIGSSDVGFWTTRSLERIVRLLAWSVGAVVVALLLRELADVLSRCSRPSRSRWCCGKRLGIWNGWCRFQLDGRC